MIDLMDTERVRGKTWTLVFGLTLLFVTFGLAYAYVIPRLGCELISRSASLEFRACASEPTEGWPPMTLPDGAVRYVSPEAAWNVAHFSAFQHVFHASPPEVFLLMSDAGRQQYHEPMEAFVVMLHDKPIAEVNSDEWTPSQVSLHLKGVSDPDANEVLARLTE